MIREGEVNIFPWLVILNTEKILPFTDPKNLILSS